MMVEMIIYDGDDDNIDEIDDKNDKKNIQILWLLSKKLPILGPFTLWKEGQQIRAGASPPPDSGNAWK